MYVYIGYRTMTTFITSMDPYFSKNRFGGLILGGRGTISGRPYNRVGVHMSTNKYWSLHCFYCILMLIFLFLGKKNAP